MARPSPHHRALFSLIPDNDLAMAILSDPQNDSLVSVISQGDDAHTSGTPQTPKNALGLDVGYNIGNQSGNRLASMGQRGSIVVDDPCTPGLHLSFELVDGGGHEGELSIMLFDRSTDLSTQVRGTYAFPIRTNSLGQRQVLVHPKMNLEFGFGGPTRAKYCFRIHWHVDNPNFSSDDFPVIYDSQLGRIQGVPAHTEGTLESSTHTGAAPSSLIVVRQRRYVEKLRVIGGTSGRELVEVVHADTGEHLAMKKISTLGPNLRKDRINCHRQIFSGVAHANIVAFRGHEDTGRDIRLFMDLKLGSVRDLIERESFMARGNNNAWTLLQNMLSALQYLSSKRPIHRNLKPENILYAIAPNGPPHHTFQLAGFSQASYMPDANSFEGTPTYMAPEMFDEINDPPQTPKMDIWSLFMTIAEVMNFGGVFRGSESMNLGSNGERMAAAQVAASDGNARRLKRMAIEDPEQRASAEEMLQRLLNDAQPETPQ